MADGDVLTGRKPGYLAAIDNVPPLIFRFQINPEILNEKRTYKWDPANTTGAWNFKRAGQVAAGAAVGLAAALLPSAGLGELADNVKQAASALVKTRGLKSNEGEPRSIAIDFALDATLADVLDEGDHYGGSIEPDLAILRSFVNPAVDLASFGQWMFSGYEREKLPTLTPPLCSLYFVGLSITCVMTDLSIKVTAYKDDGSPQRADVSVTLKEQVLSVSPLVEFVTRNIDVVKSYGRKNFGKDVLNVLPIVNLFT